MSGSLLHWVATHPHTPVPLLESVVGYTDEHDEELLTNPNLPADLTDQVLARSPDALPAVLRRPNLTYDQVTHFLRAEIETDPYYPLHLAREDLLAGSDGAVADAVLDRTDDHTLLAQLILTRASGHYPQRIVARAARRVAKGQGPDTCQRLLLTAMARDQQLRAELNHPTSGSDALRTLRQLRAVYTPGRRRWYLTQETPTVLDHLAGANVSQWLDAVRSHPDPDEHLAQAMLARFPTDVDVLHELLGSRWSTPLQQAAALSCTSRLLDHVRLGARLWPTVRTLPGEHLPQMVSKFHRARHGVHLLGRDDLDPDLLNTLLNLVDPTVTTDGDGHNTTLLLTGVAAHPNATPHLRERCGRIVQSLPERWQSGIWDPDRIAIVTAFVHAVDPLTAVGSLPLPVVLRSNTAPALDFVLHTYLSAQLPGVCTPVAADLLTALADRFTGTLNDLFNTVRGAATSP